jgi:hypothetical protein
VGDNYGQLCRRDQLPNSWHRQYLRIVCLNGTYILFDTGENYGMFDTVDSKRMFGTDIIYKIRPHGSIKNGLVYRIIKECLTKGIFTDCKAK